MTSPTTHETATQLDAVVAQWRDKLLAISEESAQAKPASDRWSISEVVGHLVDSACNNHQRFVRAQRGEELVFPKYEQNQWVHAANYQQCDRESLVQLWYHYNRLIVNLIRNIPESELSTPCTITPYDTCTLGFLVTDYLDHLNHHIGKIAERLDTSNLNGEA